MDNIENYKDALKSVQAKETEQRKIIKKLLLRMTEKDKKIADLELQIEFYKNEIDRLLDKHEKQLRMDGVSTLTLEEGKQMVDYGFWYAENSQNNGSVPVGNYLQKLVSVKGLIEPPKEWDDYIRKNRY